jgi:hypothetical protein
MSRPTVQQFIETWEKSMSVSEVAEKTKLTKPTVQAKATQLRKLGIPLKKYKGARNPINVGEALEVLAKIRGVSVASLKKEAEAEARKAARRGNRQGRSSRRKTR